MSDSPDTCGRKMYPERKSCGLKNRDLKMEFFFCIPCEPQTSRSQVTSALPSGLRFEVYVCTAKSGSRGKRFTARFFAL